MQKCGVCGNPNGREWWAGKNSEWVCEPCALKGNAKQTPDAIREKIAARAGAEPPIPYEPRSSATRTKADDLGPSSPAAALRAVTQAAEQLAVAMREAPPIPESMLPQFRELWSAVWALAGVPPPPLTAAVTGGKGGEIPRKKFSPGAGITTAVRELETCTKDAPPASGRKAFVPGQGFKAEEDTADRKPRFSVGT